MLGGSTFTETGWTQGHVLSTGFHELVAGTDFTAFDIAIGQYIGQYSGSGKLERDSGGGIAILGENSIWSGHFHLHDRLKQDGVAIFSSFPEGS